MGVTYPRPPLTSSTDKRKLTLKDAPERVMKKIDKIRNPFNHLLVVGVMLTLGGCTNSILEPPTLALGLTTMALLLLRINRKN